MRSLLNGGVAVRCVPSEGSFGPLGFEPAAVSFASTRDGWELGSAGCDGCAALRRTRDGGRTWAALPSLRSTLFVGGGPGVGVRDLVFADRSNGFLFGPGLFASHDGGRSWRRQSVPAVASLRLGGGYAYALTIRPEGIWRARVGGTGWRRLRLPAAAREIGELSVEGTTLVVLRLGHTKPGPGPAGRIWFSGDRGLSWGARTVPCTQADGSAALMAVTRARPRSWLIDCTLNLQSSQAQHVSHHLFRSDDSGRSWTRLADPTRRNDPTLLADNGAGHEFLATEGVHDELVGSFDGGRRWRALIRSGGSFFGWADLQFLDERTGFVVGPTNNAPEHVYRTDDGGRSWRLIDTG